MKRIEANGETWEVSLSDDAPHAGVRAVVFHCVSNALQGWRVAEVSADRFGSEAELHRLDDDALGKLFRGSDAFDYVHEEKADPHHPVRAVPPEA